MKFAFALDESIESGTRRIAGELIDHAVAELESGDVEIHTAIHEVRKDCKKIRALLRLVRPQFPETYRRENQAFRDAAAALSDIRDAEAALECYGAMAEHFGWDHDWRRLAPVRQALREYKRRCELSALELDERLEDFKRRMAEARQRVQEWHLPDNGFAGVGDGLMLTYRRGRKAMKASQATPSVELYHEWRKRAKYLRYQSQLLQAIWKPVMKGYRGEVTALSDVLGDDHDLAVLRELLLDKLGPFPGEGRVPVLLELMARRSAELRARAWHLGRRVYAEKPKAFRARLKAYWEAARAERGAARLSERAARSEARSSGVATGASTRMASPRRSF